uniref:Chromosome 14 open reading frame 119 n=1 Tax=Oryzias latipes TaxID=8090 RepID=A0A3P9H221_ORYLA
MSWFNQVNQGSHPQQPAEIQSFVPSNSTCNPPNGPGIFYTPTGAGLSTPSPSPSYDFPSAPRAGASPLRLENLSCAAQSSDHVQDPPEPISYVTLQEQRCVLSWFQGWSSSQRERFLQDLLGKAVPGKVCTLLDSLSTLQVQDKLPNIFECQLRLWTQWFESWREEERNHFLHMLEEHDPTFVALFYKSVAGTAGRD